MGTSRVILASGMFVMIGMYSLSFRTADEASFSVANGQSLHIQAAQIALAGIKFARNELHKIQDPKVPTNIDSVSLQGGKVKYVIERPSGYPLKQLKVTSIGTFSNHTIVYISVLTWDDPALPGDWRVTNTYLRASADEYKKLN